MMMKFGTLESIRKNPQAFYDSGIKMNGRSKLLRWQDALSRFHKGAKMADAEAYLVSSFSHYKDNAPNRRDLVKFIRYLYEYEEDYNKLGSEKVEFRKVLTLDLAADNQISGQVPRVDINTKEDGYSIYYFSRKNFEWESELRFPILQQGIADYFGCDAEHVKVGVYVLDDGKHYSTTYDAAELKSAQDELQQLIEEVRKIKK